MLALLNCILYKKGLISNAYTFRMQAHNSFIQSQNSICLTYPSKLHHFILSIFEQQSGVCGEFLSLVSLLKVLLASLGLF